MMKKVKSFNEIHKHKMCRDLYFGGIESGGWWLLLEIPDELVDGDHCLNWFYKSWLIQNNEDIEDFPVMTKKQVVQWFNWKVEDYNDFKSKQGRYKSILND
tara:strand:- start:2730 stop:3032 length:303 start_codon:yes stop_codon:yes gene_type:complete